MSITPLKGRGIRQVTTGLGTLDREFFEAVAESPGTGPCACTDREGRKPPAVSEICGRHLSKT